MVSYFAAALTYVLKNEGGYTFHPADKGGPTNMGITKKTLEAWRGKSVETIDIENLEYSEASAIYKELYWIKVKGHLLTCLPTAIAIFDAAVLFGVSAASTRAQAAASYCGRKVTIDGVIGPRSVAALNFLDAKEFVPEFHGLLSAKILRIIEKDPKQKVFLKGWQNRLDRMLTLLNEDTLNGVTKSSFSA